MDFEQKLKSEPIDDYEEYNHDPLRDHDYCKNPAKLLKPKFEEPDHYQLDRLSPKSSNFEYPEHIKSEPTPVNESFEYPAYMKLESVDGYDQEVPFLGQTTYQETRKCSLCSLIMNKDYFIITGSKNRKIIVILGAVLSGKMCIFKAKKLFFTTHTTTCPSHFSEAIDEIFKFLRINCLNEMHSCSIVQKVALMETVESVSSTFTFTQLSDALIDYCRRDGSLLGPPVFFKPEPDSMIYKRKILSIGGRRWNRCSICITVDQPHVSINATNRKLFLLIGAILTGKKTIEEAQLLISKYRFYTCKIHLSEAIDEIFRVLKIKHFDEMQSCSIDDKESLMSLVNLLCAVPNFSEFSVFFENFIRNSDYM